MKPVTRVISTDKQLASEADLQEFFFSKMDPDSEGSWRDNCKPITTIVKSAPRPLFNNVDWMNESLIDFPPLDVTKSEDNGEQLPPAYYYNSEQDHSLPQNDPGSIPNPYFGATPIRASDDEGFQSIHSRSRSSSLNEDNDDNNYSFNDNWRRPIIPRFAKMGLGNNPPPQCFNNYAPRYNPNLGEYKEREPGKHKVLVYCDNSNIFINTSTFAKRMLKLKHGVRQDPRARLDMGKLFKIARKDREVLTGKLYGSEPPPLEEVWAAIAEKNIEVFHSRRSLWDSKEKQADTKLVADAVEHIVTHRHLATGNSAVILLTGDSDMVPVVQTAVKHGWGVEVWAYKDSLANELKAEAEKSEKVKFFYIDEKANEVIFLERKWKEERRHEIPRERSFVISYRENKTRKKKNGPQDPDMLLKEAVDKATTLTQLPMKAIWLNEFDLCLISILAEHVQYKEEENYVKYSFNSDIWPKVGKLRDCIKDILEIDTFVNYLQKKEPFEYTAYAEEVENVSETNAKEDSNYSKQVFVPVAKKLKTSRQLYSDPCAMNFRCKYGSQCKFKHGSEEKEFFKVVQSPKDRSGYKSKPCRAFEFNKSCKFHENSYLCKYAHGLKEARCAKCKEIGVHWTDKCRED